MSDDGVEDTLSLEELSKYLGDAVRTRTWYDEFRELVLMCRSTTSSRQ